MLIAPFNDAAAACSLIAEHGHDIAAVIVEPLQRLIPPAEGFLQALRDACTAAGIVLIFDEVVTGFRPCLWWGAGTLRSDPRFGNRG